MHCIQFWLHPNLRTFFSACEFLRHWSLYNSLFCALLTSFNYTKFGACFNIWVPETLKSPQLNTVRALYNLNNIWAPETLKSLQLTILCSAHKFWLDCKFGACFNIMSSWDIEVSTTQYCMLCSQVLKALYHLHDFWVPDILKSRQLKTLMCYEFWFHCKFGGMSQYL